MCHLHVMTVGRSSAPLLMHIIDLFLIQVCRRGDQRMTFGFQASRTAEPNVVQHARVVVFETQEDPPHGITLRLPIRADGQNRAIASADGSMRDMRLGGESGEVGSGHDRGSQTPDDMKDRESPAVHSTTTG